MYTDKRFRQYFANLNPQQLNFTIDHHCNSFHTHTVFEMIHHIIVIAVLGNVPLSESCNQIDLWYQYRVVKFAN